MTESKPPQDVLDQLKEIEQRLETSDDLSDEDHEQLKQIFGLKK